MDEILKDLKNVLKRSGYDCAMKNGGVYIAGTKFTGTFEEFIAVVEHEKHQSTLYKRVAGMPLLPNIFMRW